MTPEEKLRKKQKAAREKRMKRYERDEALGRNKTVDNFTEEAAHQAADWVERGGLARLWGIIKVALLIVFALLVMAVIALFDLAN